MIRELAQSVGNAVVENVGRAAGRVQENTPLPADLLESDDAYLVVFDAPGASANDVQVRYVENRVDVRVDRFRGFYDDFEMRYPGRGLTLDGSVTLPYDARVDAGSATATLKSNGTLQVRVPKLSDREGEIDVVADDLDGDETPDEMDVVEEPESVEADDVADAAEDSESLERDEMADAVEDQGPADGDDVPDAAEEGSSDDIGS